MKHVGKWLLFIIGLGLMLLPISAQDLPLIFDQQTDPASLIGSYYNAINVRDYGRAYRYWETAPQGRTEAQFTAGFADTISANVLVRLPIAAGVAAGNLFADIPSLVIAQHTDGTTHYYAGCFTVHKTNVPVGDAIEPNPNWVIRSGTLREAAIPDLTTIESTCATQLDLPAAPMNAEPLTAITLIQDYFATISSSPKFAPMYWQNPIGDVFAPYVEQIYYSYSLDLFVNPVILGEGAAGSVYATIPTLLVITAPDANLTYVNGCFTSRLTNVLQGAAVVVDPNFYLTDVVVTVLADGVSAIYQVLNGCSVVG